MIAVLTDSTSDLSPQAAQYFGIHVVPLNVHLKGQTFLDWQEIEPDAVYQHMLAGGQATTSPVSVEMFEEHYLKLLQTHEAVVSLHISRKLSDTVQHARLARQRLPEPERVRVIDSYLAAPPLAELAIAAKAAADQGQTLDDIERIIQQTRQEMLAEFSVASLEYLRRSGRIGRATEVMGNLLNLRPILYFNQGELQVNRRARTQHVALDILDRLKAKYGQEPVIVTIVHAGRDPERFTQLHDQVKRSGLNVKKGRSLLLGPVICAHVGPGTFGLLARPFN